MLSTKMCPFKTPCANVGGIPNSASSIQIYMYRVRCCLVAILLAHLGESEASWAALQLVQGEPEVPSNHVNPLILLRPPQCDGGSEYTVGSP